MKNAKPAILIFAAIMLMGGVGGYLKAKSLPSLLSGVISAALLTYAFMTTSASPRKGYTIAAGTAGVLILVFVERAIRTSHEASAMGRNVGLAVLSAAFCALFAAAKNSASA
jgi:uncharacterized membrane protein (UPF0136 family)